MILLELFKGTGSVGNVFEKQHWDIISVDIEKKFNPTICIDILDWDFHSPSIPIPDFIWASPPCHAFSKLAYKLKERNTRNAEPYSDRAIQGTKILYKTIEIIEYFSTINPNLKFVIENPVGMMRCDSKIKNYDRYTTYYCHYEDTRKKTNRFVFKF